MSFPGPFIDESMFSLSTVIYAVVSDENVKFQLMLIEKKIGKETKSRQNNFASYWIFELTNSLLISIS